MIKIAIFVYFMTILIYDNFYQKISFVVKYGTIKCIIKI